MSIIHRNLSLDAAYTLAQGGTTTVLLRCFFAGIIYDPADDVVYRLSAPVEVQFGEDRRIMIIPLPTVNDYPWEVELLNEPVDPAYVTVITEGPLTEDNLWEFCRSGEPNQLGQPTTINPDLHWPEWATRIRRQDAALKAEGLAAMLATLGFAPPTSNLVPPRKSGIYVLHLAEGRFYADNPLISPPGSPRTGGTIPPSTRLACSICRARRQSSIIARLRQSRSSNHAAFHC